MSDSLIVCDNFINGAYAPPKGGEYMGVDAPATGKVVGRVALSTAAVRAAPGCRRRAATCIHHVT